MLKIYTLHRHQGFFIISEKNIQEYCEGGAVVGSSTNNSGEAVLAVSEDVPVVAGSSTIRLDFFLLSMAI